MNAPARLAAFSLAMLIATATASGWAARPQPESLELAVKATFLPKFAAYVNWPPDALGAAAEPVQLCVIGRDVFGPRLDEAASRQRIDLHPLIVRRLDSTEGAERCHVAFVGGSPKQSTAAMIEALRGRPVLTVTDARLGPVRGMVHFALRDGRVRFHIDDAMAARSNLSISARLLGLALSVKPRTRA